MLGDAEIPVSITTCFQYLMLINQGKCPEWVVAIKSVSVISGSLTLLYIIIMKNLVSAKVYNFDQTSVYLKAVAFLPVTFLEQNSLLTVVYTCDKLCSLKVLLVSYKLSSQSFAQSI